MTEWISGRNPVLEVLRAGRRRAYALQILEGAQIKGRLSEILKHCQERDVYVEEVPRRELDRTRANNQGVLLNVDGYPHAPVDEIVKRASRTSGPAIVLILDSIQDPQNFGTLLRTAEAVGVAGVVIPPNRSAAVTPAVVQASAGATEYLSIAQVNLVRAIDLLKRADYWVVGMENTPEALAPEEISLNRKIALVVGSEGSGMRRLVRDSCDWIMRLPIQGEIGSLNASVAGSIALFLAWSAQGYAGNS